MAIRKLVGAIMNGRSLKSIGISGFSGLALNTYMTADMYTEAREKGSSPIGAAMRAGGELAMMELVGMPMYMGTQLAQAIPKFVTNTALKFNEQARSMSRVNRNMPFSNAAFMDTPQAYTMRQAGMQLAKAAKHNTQQTMLGNEASFMHY